MPWSETDAERFTKKADTAELKRLWASVANAALKRGIPEGDAVKEANSAVKRQSQSA